MTSLCARPFIEAKHTFIRGSSGSMRIIRGSSVNFKIIKIESKIMKRKLREELEILK